MRTIIPTPPKPFFAEEIRLLTERLEFIEAALDKGEMVVATRPHQVHGRPTNKVLDKILFHPETDADLVTMTGGALNLLDPTYTFASYPQNQLPEDVAEGLCLAHIGGTLVNGKVIFTQPQQ
jgi:hypothetical protein